LTDFTILGFLMYGPKSGYDIKRFMGMSTSHFYQASFGSIYPSLERMEKEGYVAATREDDSGRLRKPYEILPEGRAAFLEWLASPLDISRGPSLLLARLFFLGCLPRGRARKIIDGFMEGASKRREWLEGATAGLPVKPDFFQASTQRFGLEYYAFLESWLERLEKEIS
jgi:DNA-binding PadR family transcriptional regulator